MNHTTVIAKVITDNTGVQSEVPIILTDHGPLEPLLKYFLEIDDSRSFAWKTKVVEATGLLLDYMEANQHCFDNSKDLFNSFVHRLRTGTIGEDGLDPSGLYWLPQGRDKSRKISGLLSTFSDWLAERLGLEPMNPWRKANSYDEMLNWAAYHQRHDRAFLGHTWNQEKASETAKKARNTLLKRAPKVERNGVKFFPEDYFIDLLFKGFIVSGKQNSPRIEERLNLRNILITLLENCGGLRVSEAFQLYVHDIIPDPNDSNTALVRVFHPSEGLAPDDWIGRDGKPIRCNREAYLRGHYQLRPRTSYPKGNMKVGWKDPMLDSEANFFHVHWFPTWAGKLFKKLWDIYLIQRAKLDCDHPFAFISKSGRPYAIRDYSEAHAIAVSRIGLVPAKMNGTTPHGHRHAYGQRLTDAGIDPKLIKKAMHHASIESQSTYTEPNIRSVTKALSEASDSLESDVSIQPPNLVQYGFEEVDPRDLLLEDKPRLRRRHYG